MKEYKVFQRHYNLTHHHDDSLESMTHRCDDSTDVIKSEMHKYFTENVEHLIFPAKSYAVALIYAKLIEIHFKTPFFESLSDPDLFCGNDKYFKTYNEIPEIYDDFLRRIPLDRSNYILPKHFQQVATTIGYFYKEFGVKNEC